MRMFLTLATGLLLSLRVGWCLPQCTLPQSVEDIDWSRLEGSFWYEPLHVPEKSSFNCKVTTDIEATSTGFKVRIAQQFQEETASLIEFYSIGRGTYIMKTDRISDVVSHAINVATENGECVTEAIRKAVENLDFEVGVASIYTDYNWYLTVAICRGPNKDLLVKTKTPQITAQGVTDVHNFLVKIGWNDLKLELVNSCVG